MSDNKTAVVLDSGSDTTKVGFATEDAPGLVVPSVVASQDKEDRKPPLIGKDARGMMGALHLRYPVKNSIITNWDDMERASEVQTCQILLELPRRIKYYLQNSRECPVNISKRLQTPKRKIENTRNLWSFRNVMKRSLECLKHHLSKL